MPMTLANKCIALPVPNLTTLFDMPRALSNRSATKYLSASLSTARITLATLPLAPQALIKPSTHSFIDIDMAVDRLMAYRNF